MIFKANPTRKIHNFTINVAPGFKYIEWFPGGTQWYMMKTKDFISNINFKLKTETDVLISIKSGEYHSDNQSKKFNSILKKAKDKNIIPIAF